jgi:uncharacterized membrane protein YdjX (TVP38/TMEM64 family)
MAVPLILLIPAHGLTQAIIGYVDWLRMANAAAIERYYWLLLLLYFAAYTVSVMLCLPVTALMAVAGGLMFGIVSFPVAVLSVAAGSVVPFWLSRKVTLAPGKTGFEFLNRTRDKFHRNQFQFLILMRLIPWAPFSVTTIVAGSLGMSLEKFLIATAIGFLPSGLALNAIGHGLERLEDLGNLSAARLYSEPDFLIAVAGAGVVVLLSLSRRIPLISRLLD